MVNASDLIFNGKLNKDYKKLFPKKSKIRFVRIACHEFEIFKIKEVISFLKKQNYEIFVNLMQISEIKKKNLIKILKFLSKTPTDIFYIADSLGSLLPKNTKKLIELIRKFWSKDLGVHAHDNLGFALKNSNIATQAGANWVDSTVLGMGRGPGNTKTEEILKLAVKRMLPGGPLAKKQLTKLKIYKGENHPHELQKPKIIDFEKLNKKNIIK